MRAEVQDARWSRYAAGEPCRTRGGTSPTGRFRKGAPASPTEVGGEPALIFHREGRIYSVDTAQITNGLITAYRRIINPDKLQRL